MAGKEVGKRAGRRPILSQSLCAFPFPAGTAAALRKHNKSFSFRPRFVFFEGNSPRRPLAFLRGIQPIDRLHSLVKAKSSNEEK